MRALPHLPKGFIAANGGCYVCGKARSDHHGPMVDLDISIEHEGWLILCAADVNAMVSKIGGAPSDQHQKVVEENERLKKENKVLQLKAGRYKKLFDDLRHIDQVEAEEEEASDVR